MAAPDVRMKVHDGREQAVQNGDFVTRNPIMTLRHAIAMTLLGLIDGIARTYLSAVACPVEIRAPAPVPYRPSRKTVWLKESRRRQ